MICLYNMFPQNFDKIINPKVIAGQSELGMCNSLTQEQLDDIFQEINILNANLDSLTMRISTFWDIYPAPEDMEESTKSLLGPVNTKLENIKRMINKSTKSVRNLENAIK